MDMRDISFLYTPLRLNMAEMEADAGVLDSHAEEGTFAPDVRTLNRHPGSSNVYDVRSSFDRRTYNTVCASPRKHGEAVPAAFETGTADDHDAQLSEATTLRHQHRTNDSIRRRLHPDGVRAGTRSCFLDSSLVEGDISTTDTECRCFHGVLLYSDVHRDYLCFYDTRN